MYVEWIGQIKDISELNEYEVAWEYLKKFMLGEGRLFHTQHDVDKASKKIEELIEKSKAKKPITIKPSGESVFDYVLTLGNVTKCELVTCGNIV